MEKGQKVLILAPPFENTKGPVHKVGSSTCIWKIVHPPLLNDASKTHSGNSDNRWTIIATNPFFFAVQTWIFQHDNELFELFLEYLGMLLVRCSCGRVNS